jgi:hypothetical protein
MTITECEFQRQSLSVRDPSSLTEELINVQKYLDRKPIGKRPLRRPRREADDDDDDDNKRSLKETLHQVVNWTQFLEGRVKWQAFVNTLTNLGVPEMVGNFLTS